MITIIRAHGRRLAKLIRDEGTIEACDRARTFDLIEMNIADLAAVEWLLRNLQTRRDCCVVRGAIANAASARRVRRLLHPDLETGDGPTLREVRGRWVTFDFGSLPLPEHVAVCDLFACARAVIRVLPKPFKGTCCIVQATARHGIAPGIRLRLWYWLDRPITGASGGRQRCQAIPCRTTINEPARSSEERQVARASSGPNDACGGVIDCLAVSPEFLRDFVDCVAESRLIVLGDAALLRRIWQQPQAGERLAATQLFAYTGLPTVKEAVFWFDHRPQYRLVRSRCAMGYCIRPAWRSPPTGALASPQQGLRELVLPRRLPTERNTEKDRRGGAGFHRPSRVLFRSLPRGGRTAPKEGGDR
jgi:hypothetical protein